MTQASSHITFNPDRPIRLGIIGASTEGWARTAHLPAIATIPGLEVSAVSTTRMESARETAREFGVPEAYDNAEDLIASDSVDAVILAVRVEHHFELLQQIASHTFEEDDVVRDSIEKSAFTIAESPEFAPFARHARLGRHEQAEKVALEHAVVQESRSTMGKTILGLSLLGVLLLSVGIWFMTSRGSKRDEIAIVEETAANVESDHGLKASKKAKAGGGAAVCRRFSPSSPRCARSPNDWRTPAASA